MEILPWTKDRVRHTIGNLLRRATSLLQTSSQYEVWAGSYELPKSRESKPGQFRDSSLRVPRIKTIWMQVSQSNAENIIWGKVVASPEFGPWWVKWVRVARGLSQHPKCFQRWTNQLVVGFVVGCEWVNKLVPLPSPIPEPRHTPLSLLVLSAGSTPSSPQTSAFLKLRPPWA
jgi:hypothetical protein